MTKIYTAQDVRLIIQEAKQEEREACAAILRKWIDSFNYEPEMDEILAEILARGQ